MTDATPAGGRDGAEPHGANRQRRPRQAHDQTGLILVTGVPGPLRWLVVQRLRDDRRDMRVLSRRAHETQTQIEFIRGDLLKGEGLEQAVESVSVVIHRASAQHQGLKAQVSPHLR